VAGQRLPIISRLKPQSRAYDGITVAIQELPESQNREIRKRLTNPVAFTPVRLSTDVEAPEAWDAAEKVAGVLESLVDIMGFEMGAPILIGQVEILDITPPIAVDDEREYSTFASLPFSSNIESLETETILGRLEGELPDIMLIADSRHAAALRWFVKSLGTARLHDQFIFLWIALEILCDELGEKITTPYVGPCRHEIKECPECGEETAKIVRGETLKVFLESFGVTKPQAKKLWQMRQLMHGAISFDSKKLEDLASLVQLLRAAVSEGLKDLLGKDPADPPLIAPAGLSLRPPPAISGTYTVKEEHLNL
jgi:hypothetical protein